MMGKPNLLILIPLLCSSRVDHLNSYEDDPDSASNDMHFTQIIAQLECNPVGGIAVLTKSKHHMKD